MSSKKPYCVAPWTSLYLDPMGKVYPCCIWQQQGQYVGEVDGFGNINENTLEEIYNSKEAQRVKKAMEESGYGSAMNVLYCQSGCNGNWVQVRFHHDGYAGQAADYGEPLTAMVEKYNELYGNDSYEQDGDKVQEALMPDGMRIRHLMLMPDMSSTWD